VTLAERKFETRKVLRIRQLLRLKKGSRDRGGIGTSYLGKSQVTVELQGKNKRELDSRSI
jgi:hypothetical protein